MKKKFIISSMIAMITSVLFAGVPIASSASFTDVPTTHRYFDAITFVQENGIVKGYDDGTYKPETPVNRAEMLKIIVESKFDASEFEPFADDTCFDDVPANDWYTGYVCFAKDKGIVQGYSDNTFRPAQIVNFAEALKITSKGYGSTALETSEPWFRNYVDEAAAKNLIPLDVTEFGNYVTRGQMAEMITRFVKESTGELDAYLGDLTSIVNDFDTIDAGGFITSDLSNIEVDWQESLTESDLKYVVIGKAYQTPGIDTFILNNIGMPTDSDPFKEVKNYYTFYKAGSLSNTEYAGDDFLTIDIFYPVMGGSRIANGIYDYARNRIILLEGPATGFEQIENALFKPVTDSYVAALETSGDIPIEGSDLKLQKKETSNFEPNLLFSEYEDLTNVFTTGDDKNVYLDKYSFCFIIEKPDGTIAKYAQELGFLLEGDVLDVKWDDNTQNEDSYKSGVAGIFNGCHEIVYDVDMASLTQTGTTVAGDSIYEYADPETQALVDVYENDYFAEEKVIYDEFIASHPVVFWVSPLGYTIRFVNSRFAAPVEMGKPVIYLYPEYTTDVNVQVNPNGGLTYTEPKYSNSGWDVIAYPTGKLINKSDKKEYPYLFWEGKGFNYSMPEKGFVVTAKDLSGFLDKTLAKLGLNDQEVKDFKDFWVPKMLLAKKPYYFVTFVSQTEFDALAPLKVTPKPDSVIRVFMDYKPLDSFKTVEPLKIETLERTGFTVVEWGGALGR